MKTILIFIFLILTNLSFSQENKMNNQINKIIVFGDGLSDMGRWGKLTNYKYPPADAGFFESR